MGSPPLAVPYHRQPRQRHSSGTGCHIRWCADRFVRPAALDYGASVVQERNFAAHAGILPRCTYVHAANIALFILILLWQPIPVVVWTSQTPLRELLSTAFVGGWIILLLGALSFGIRNLLGVRQMQAWAHGHRWPPEQLKTSLLYRWFRHPMYVGVLLAISATPHMTIGHWLLATGMTVYVLIALRYEERDLRERFGNAYARWAAKPR